MDNTSKIRIEIQGAVGAGKSEVAALINKYLCSLNLNVVVQNNEGIEENLSKNENDLITVVKKSKITITELNTFK